METFEQELTGLINRKCEENGSDTPDFILARYLQACLRAFNNAVNQRERWCGREKTEAVTDTGPASTN